MLGSTCSLLHRQLQESLLAEQAEQAAQVAEAAEVQAAPDEVPWRTRGHSQKTGQDWCLRKMWLRKKMLGNYDLSKTTDLLLDIFCLKQHVSRCPSFRGQRLAACRSGRLWCKSTAAPSSPAWAV